MSWEDDIRHVPGIWFSKGGGTVVPIPPLAFFDEVQEDLEFGLCSLYPFTQPDVLRKLVRSHPEVSDYLEGHPIPGGTMERCLQWAAPIGTILFKSDYSLLYCNQLTTCHTDEVELKRAIAGLPEDVVSHWPKELLIHVCLGNDLDVQPVSRTWAELTMSHLTPGQRFAFSLPPVAPREPIEPTDHFEAEDETEPVARSGAKSAIQRELDEVTATLTAEQEPPARFPAAASPSRALPPLVPRPASSSLAPPSQKTINPLGLLLIGLGVTLCALLVATYWQNSDGGAVNPVETKRRSNNTDGPVGPRQTVSPSTASSPPESAQTAKQSPSGGMEGKQPTASLQTSSSPSLYTNRRHGYAILVPAILASTLQENSSGDSVTATSNDGRTKLLLRVKQGVGTVETLYKQWTAEHTARDSGKVVNYKTLHGDWFVVSGYDGLRGYYVKVIVRGSEALFMALEYDESARNLTNAALTTMSRSFTAKLDAASGYQPELNPPFAAAAAKGDVGNRLQRTLPNGAVADPYANYATVRPLSAQPPAPSPVMLSRVYTVPELKKLVGTRPAGAGLRGDFVLVKQEGNQVLLQSGADLGKYGITSTTNGQEDIYRGHTFVTVTCSRDMSRFISGQLVTIPAEQPLRIISVSKNSQGQIDAEASF